MVGIATKKSAKIDTNSLPPLYKCTKCGKVVQSPKGIFYMSKTFELYEGNESYSNVCCHCVNEYFENQKIKYKDEKIAIMLTCCAIGVYFSEELYENIKDNGEIKFGNFIKALNGTQYRSKNFTTFLINTIKDDSIFRGSQAIQNDKETNWKSSDYKNKKYVIQSVGYDCFDDESYSDANRKFLFNTLADYLTDDVLEDPHKLQRVIAMVKTTLQVENIDKMINGELKKSILDYALIDKLSSVKDKLSRNINATANENGISAKSSGKTNKGANALTNIMKEMSENNFEDIKLNIVSVKLSESYKEIAEDNAKALFNELNLTSDDYARMLAELSEINKNNQESIMNLEEDMRLLKIQNKNLKLQIENSDGDK